MYHPFLFSSVSWDQGSMKSDFFLEYRQNPEEKNDFKKIFPSLKFFSRFISIHAGYRYIPGPSGYYYADPKFFSGFFDVEHGRALPLLFLQPFPEWHVPGIYFMEGENKPGIFIADPYRRFMISLHPSSKTGNLSLLFNEGQLPFRLYTDIFKTSSTAEGYFSLSRQKNNSVFHFLFEGERREKWDDEVPENTDINRKGKSGQLLARIQWIPEKYIHLESLAGGLDRGSNGYRFFKTSVSPAGSSPAGKFVVEGRVYKKRTYGETMIHEAPFYSAALGWKTGDANGFSLVLEKRSTETLSGELHIYFQTGNLHFSLSGIFCPKFLDMDREFLFIQKNSFRGSGSEFLKQNGALFASVRNEYVYFSISSYRTGKKSHTEMNLQFRMKL